METIFQRFDLNLEAIANLGKEELSKINLPRAGSALRDELVKRGYTVLESNDFIGSAPKSIIVGQEYGKNHKQDFYAIAERLGLPYKSEAFYTCGGSVIKK